MRENFVFRQVKETVMTMETTSTILTESLMEIDKAGIWRLKDFNQTVTVTENNTDADSARFGRAA